MPEQKKIAKAVLQQISWNSEGDVTSEGATFEVQFNPETLTLAFSNQVAGGDQAGGSAIQFNSKGTTKLSFDLVFDVTDPKIAQRFNGNNKPGSRTDVRKITQLVMNFMQTEPTGSGRNTRFVPPGVRFSWGTFRFDGVVDSLNEKLDFFSEDGVPLRSTIGVSITKQDVDVNFNESAAGTDQTVTPNDKDNMGVVLRHNPEQWQGDALANGIENPRDLPMGSPLSLGSEAALSLNASLQGKAGMGIGGGFGLEGSIGGSFGVGISGGLDLGIDAGLDAGLDLGGGLGVDLGGGLGVDLSSDLGFGIDASTDLAINGGTSIGGSADFDAGVSVGGSASAEFDF